MNTNDPHKSTKKRTAIIGTSLASLALIGGLGFVTAASATAGSSAKAPTAQSQQADHDRETHDDQEQRIQSSVQAPPEQQGTETPDDQETQALQSLAKISAAEAEKAATAAVPGSSVIATELGDEDGSVVYEVVVQVHGAQTEVAVDAGNGAVLAQERGDGDGEQNEAQEGTSQDGESTDGAPAVSSTQR